MITVVTIAYYRKQYYTLDPIVLICPPLTAPDNGYIDCLLGDDGEANPGDTCTFRCDDGHVLEDRTCGDNGSWSGTETTCTSSTYDNCFLCITLAHLYLY